MLPDYVLLETFKFYLGKDYADKFDGNHNYDGWQTLVHVSRRWRCIVFASPCCLDLKLYCTQRRSVNSKTLDIWPALPIVIVALDRRYKEDVTNVIAALRHHNRVCRIYFSDVQFQDSLLKEFAAIDEPFPALTSLELFSFGQNVPVLPNSFLGGSAPQLRSLELAGIPYSSIGKLLSSTTNLVRLSLWRIPHSGYIAPETIVPFLSMLPKLKSLELGFKHPRSEAHRASRHPLSSKRVVFPSLTFLRFGGNIDYLEDILSQIETPMLNRSYLLFFNRLVFNAPLLGHFIRRTEAFRTVHRARIQFHTWAVWVTLWRRGEKANNDQEALHFEISCKPFDWQLSAISQVLNSFLSSISTLESLEITVPREDGRDEIEVIQWRDFFHMFTSVKDMTLEFEHSVRVVAPALQELAGEKATEALPALRDIFLRTYDWQPPAPVKEEIDQFIAVRQVNGRPVTIHY